MFFASGLEATYSRVSVYDGSGDKFVVFLSSFVEEGSSFNAFLQSGKVIRFLFRVFLE